MHWKFTFEVREYLKGSGGIEVKAVAFDVDDWYDTRAEAEAADTDFLSTRDTQWDDREAIVFLSNAAETIPSVSAADRYWLTYMRVKGEDGYTVASRWDPVWLPDAAAPSGASGASGAGEQEFLLEAPSSLGRLRSKRPAEDNHNERTQVPDCPDAGRLGTPETGLRNILSVSPTDIPCRANRESSRQRVRPKGCHMAHNLTEALNRVCPQGRTAFRRRGITSFCVKRPSKPSLRVRMSGW